MKPYLITLVLTLLLAILIVAAGEHSAGITAEGGIVENTTVLLYAGLVIALLFFADKLTPVNRGLGSLLILFLMLRELDFHKKFTTFGIFKTELYRSPDVALVEKFLAGGFILLLVTITYLLLRSNLSRLLSGIKKGHRTACGILAALILVGCSKVLLDGLPRKLEKLGMEANEFVVRHHGTLEETLELAIPACLLLSVFYAQFPSKKTRIEKAKGH